MTNRKNLHDYGLLLIFLSILNLFMFASIVIADLVNGSIQEALSTVEPDILLAVKIVLGVFGAIMVLLIAADAFIGIKALKVSAKPTADKGYITVAKVFFVLSIIATIANLFGLFDNAADHIDAVLSFLNTALSAVVYFYFIKSAQAVRNDFLNGVK
jgi:hypothetical protein